MAATYTLPGVLLSGTHASRPAANAVAAGTLYNETDTLQAYQSDGASTWTAWGPSYSGSGMANPMTTTGDTIYSSSGSTPARLAAGAVGTFLAGGGASTAPAWGAVVVKRQGGSSTDWTTPGTTAYTPATATVQAGSSPSVTV